MSSKIESNTDLQIETIENSGKDIENSRKIDNQNYKFIIIGISIICLSLIYYYWDNIFELFKPDNKPDNNAIIPSVNDNTNWVNDNPLDLLKWSWNFILNSMIISVEKQKK
uniref:Uncharacterized protein n=1 Tax=Russula subnigricans TaxID=258989 RepID=A0A649WI60_9AGAM|nr:hypothetical protein [Russula subnigricans]QGK88091.1 hypothetical protein [Russula subnigricans]